MPSSLFKFFAGANMRILGIEFAPLSMPMERRIQTLAVLMWGLLFLLSGLVTILTLIYWFFYTTYFWPLTLVYIVWYVYDVNTCNRGGRR